MFPKDLRREWDKARAKAAAKAEENSDHDLAADIRALWLRDMRKMAADLAPDTATASKLLQHSSVGLTGRHYRSKGDPLKPVR